MALDDFSLIALLTLAGGLGLLHALDADHIVAVTSLSCARDAGRRSVNFCLQWALGHGSALLLIGGGVLLLGMAIPDALSHLAETLVGAVLIVIGLGVIVDLLRRDTHLHFHQHNGLPSHAHWHQHDGHAPHQHDAHRHQHKALLVGMLHGTAGSAPLLALLPMAQLQKPLWALAYLLMFNLGVLLAMLVFGGTLGRLLRWIQQRSERVIRGLRMTIGVGAVSLGVVWLYGSI